jgi:hypothetical protein
MGFGQQVNSEDAESIIPRNARVNRTDHRWNGVDLAAEPSIATRSVSEETQLNASEILAYASG